MSINTSLFYFSYNNPFANFVIIKITCITSSTFNELYLACIVNYYTRVSCESAASFIFM